MPLNVGITGSRGFIASHIAAQLQKKKGVRLSHFDLPHHDILDGKALQKFAKGKDVIIHAAAVNRGTDTEVIAGTVVGVHNLIAAVEHLKKKPKIIFLSSVQAETQTLYGISKRLAEVMLEDFARSHKAAVSIFRLANVFGEGCKPFYNSVVATFCYQLAHGETLKVNPSSNRINFIYVGNVGKLVAAEAVKKSQKRFYFKRVDSRDMLTVPELAKKLQGFASGRAPKSTFEQNLYRTYLSYIGK